MTCKSTVLIALFVCAGFAAVVRAQRPSPDWTEWRGPARDGAIPSFTAPASWPDQLTQKWKVTVGLGYATPLVVGNRLYVFSRQGDNEVMSALDAANGSVIWQTGYPAAFTMHKAAAPHGQGPKSTPVVADGKLFAIGMTGIVTAFDAGSGKQIWQKPGSPVVPIYTSHAFSPLVDHGLVIFHVGGNDQGALTAFDVKTGAVKWSWNGDGPGYGSPIVAELDGTRQIVTITQARIIGVDAATGALLWERPYPSPSTTNCVTPVLYGQTLIVSGNGGPTVAFTAKKQGGQWVTETVWENPDIPYRLTNSVLVGNTLFGMTSRNSGQYFSVDAKTGKTLWTSEGRQATNAAILRAGDIVFSLQDDGDLVVFRSGPTTVETVKRYKVADSATWTQPAVSGHRLFVKDVSTLALWTLD